MNPNTHAHPAGRILPNHTITGGTQTYTALRLSLQVSITGQFTELTLNHDYILTSNTLLTSSELPEEFKTLHILLPIYVVALCLRRLEIFFTSSECQVGFFLQIVRTTAHASCNGAASHLVSCPSWDGPQSTMVARHYITGQNLVYRIQEITCIGKTLSPIFKLHIPVRLLKPWKTYPRQ